MVRSGVISDELWAVLEPVLPSEAGRQGRPWRDHRHALEGICWRFRTGSPWRDVPEQFGPWQTLWKRHRRWSEDGTYERMRVAATAVAPQAAAADGVRQLLGIDSTVVRAHQHAAGARTVKGGGVELQEPRGEPDDHALGRSRGGLTTKIHVLADTLCRPVLVKLTQGQAGDNPMLKPLIDQHRTTARRRPWRLVADKAYSHRSTRQLLRRLRIKHDIPERRDQVEHRKAKGRAGGRPPAFDPEIYAHRNTVERAFGRLKQWRGVATRYDKYAITYLGGVTLAVIITNHRAGLGDTPKVAVVNRAFRLMVRQLAYDVSEMSFATYRRCPASPHGVVVIRGEPPRPRTGCLRHPQALLVGHGEMPGRPRPRHRWRRTASVCDHHAAARGLQLSAAGVWDRTTAASRGG